MNLVQEGASESAREGGVASLGDRGAESVADAGIDTLAGEATETPVHSFRVLLGELRDGTDAELIEVAEHWGTDGD